MGLILQVKLQAHHAYSVCAHRHACIDTLESVARPEGLCTAEMLHLPFDLLARWTGLKGWNIASQAGKEAAKIIVPALASFVFASKRYAITERAISFRPHV